MSVSGVQSQSPVSACPQISALTLRLGRLEFVQQGAGTCSSLKLLLRHLSAEQCPAIGWDEFQVRPASEAGGAGIRGTVSVTESSGYEQSGLNVWRALAGWNGAPLARIELIGLSGACRTGTVNGPAGQEMSTPATVGK